MMHKPLSALLAVLMVVPSLTWAQNSSNPSSKESLSSAYAEAKVSALISEAEQYFRRGEAANQQQNFEAARLEFDRAVDTILKGNLDIQSHPRLKTYFLSLIEKINALEVKAISQGTGTTEQRYEPSLLDELAEVQLDQAEAPDEGEEIDQPTLDFAFTLTPQVRQFIHYFSNTKKGRATMATGLQRAGKYLPLARQIFQEEGVPLDLVWLAQAESNWRTHARSWASAVGIWQFVSWRGQQYGLRQNEWIDERRGIEQPTRAAARYLRFLYDRFLDWQLAMAAYNCGEGRVDRAIAATGYADFWYLYNRGMLPRETRNYIPIILAIIIIAKNPKKYGLDDIQPEAPIEFASVTVSDSLDLRLVAEITNTPYEVIEGLNPELKRGVTPPDMNYNLRLPSGTDEQFIALLERIPEDRRDVWRVVYVKEGDTLVALAEQHELSAEQIVRVNNLALDAPLLPGTALVLPFVEARTPLRGRVDDSGVQMARRSSRRTMITVRSGDTLTRIAARYGISVRELARLNKLSVRSQLRVGQKLVVNLPAAISSRPVPASRSTSYQVRRGDSLTSIARRHGVSVADLREWNGLRSNKISVGQRLMVSPQANIKRTASKRTTYSVKRGDTLSSIARRYGVSVNDLRSWNHLKSDKLVVGQRLRISR
jgi:membrane-bound lytic murein transglycosylase D